MKPSRPIPARRAVSIALSLAGALAVLSGCEEGTMVTRGFVDNGGPQALAAAPVTAVAALYSTDGPRLAFDNQTSKNFEIRWWVGRIDLDEPTGYADLRTAQHLGVIVPPGKKIARHTGRKPWPTGTVDAVVQIEVRERMPDGTLGEATWLDLPRPGPYLLRAKETEGVIAYDRPRGKGEVVTIPADQAPIGRNGEFPVYPETVSMGSR